MVVEERGSELHRARELIEEEACSSMVELGVGSLRQQEVERSLNHRVFRQGEEQGRSLLQEKELVRVNKGENVRHEIDDSHPPYPP